MEEGTRTDCEKRGRLRQRPEGAQAPSRHVTATPSKATVHPQPPPPKKNKTTSTNNTSFNHSIVLYCISEYSRRRGLLRSASITHSVGRGRCLSQYKFFKFCAIVYLRGSLEGQCVREVPEGSRTPKCTRGYGVSRGSSIDLFIHCSVCCCVAAHTVNGRG